MDSMYFCVRTRVDHVYEPPCRVEIGHERGHVSGCKGQNATQICKEEPLILLIELLLDTLADSAVRNFAWKQDGSGLVDSKS